MSTLSGFKIAVDDAERAVQVLEGQTDLGDVQPRHLLRQVADVAKQREEVAAVDELHHHVQVVGRGERVVQPDDERVLRMRHHLSLGLDVLDLILPLEILLPNHLDRVQVSRGVRFAASTTRPYARRESWPRISKAEIFTSFGRPPANGSRVWPFTLPPLPPGPSVPEVARKGGAVPGAEPFRLPTSSGAAQLARRGAAGLARGDPLGD